MFEIATSFMWLKVIKLLTNFKLKKIKNKKEDEKKHIITIGMGVLKGNYFIEF